MENKVISVKGNTSNNCYILDINTFLMCHWTSKLGRCNFFFPPSTPEETLL